jgi:hypothetical protein
MKLTSGLVLKVFLALAPAVVGSVVTYWLSKGKTADGYSTLSGSVNELQGAVEELRLEVRHIQDLHFAQHPSSPPASMPFVAVVKGMSHATKAVGSVVAIPVGDFEEKTPRPKAFKRVPLRLDDARKR